MTDRKPAGLPWESWIDRQIREAEARGQFDNLPGAGKPLADLDRPYDDLWWVRQKLQREGLSVLPPGLALRREVERFADDLASVPTETLLRRLIGELNEQIVRVNSKLSHGPPSGVRPLEVDATVQQWRRRAAMEEPPGPAAPARQPRTRRRFWRRRVDPTRAGESAPPAG